MLGARCPPLTSRTHLDSVLVALLCLQLPPSLEKPNRGLWGVIGGLWRGYRGDYGGVIGEIMGGFMG